MRRLGLFLLGLFLLGSSLSGLMVSQTASGQPVAATSASSAAVPAPDLAQRLVGTWRLDADGIAFWKVVLSQEAGRWTASIVMPKHFQMEGDAMRHVSGPEEASTSTSARVDGDAVVFNFGTGEDAYALRMRPAAGAGIDMTFEGMSYGPYVLVRAKGPVRLGPWDAGEIYHPAFDWPTNPEMTAIFDADQAARQHKMGEIDWKVVGPQDTARRQRTQELLDQGKLQSADDYYHAAFVFQHGDEADDYLKAHALAMIASTRGNSAAVWISAAALDRYLMKIGQPQVFGTQYMQRDKEGFTQQPYNRTLFSDAMRQAAHVPDQAQQAERVKQLDAELAATKAGTEAGATK